MDYYEHYFKMVRKHTNQFIDHHSIYISLVSVITESAFATKQDLIDLTSAYNDYQEELNNERITSTVSAV